VAEISVPAALFWAAALSLFGAAACYVAALEGARRRFPLQFQNAASARAAFGELVRSGSLPDDLHRRHVASILAMALFGGLMAGDFARAGRHLGGAFFLALALIAAAHGMRRWRRRRHP
jgi:hypothetical protein